MKDKVEQISQEIQNFTLEETNKESQTHNDDAEIPDASDPKKTVDFHVGANNFINNTDKEIDYKKLINQFGCEEMKPEMLERFERLIGKPLHPLIRRGMFISHRDLGIFLDKFEKKEPIYLYTGRGPSSESMHLGHLIPFLVTQWMQEVFQCPLVIQLTDDEKFFYQKEEVFMPLSHFTALADENSKDIIACGFDPERTFIFKNTTYINYLYANSAHIQKLLTYNQIKGLFGLKGSDNVGKCSFPPLQSAAAISSSFPFIFGDDPKKPAFCLVPHGIDQDPYFRMMRDIAPRLGCPKPSTIQSKFFPGLQGFNTKMSSSDPSSAIFLTDSPDEIKRKIKKYAFSGGKASIEEHRKYGADLDVDIPYNYLRFFYEDDEKLSDIAQKYKSGEMLTGEIKSILIETLQKIVKKHQEFRVKTTSEVVAQFMKIRPLKLI